MIVCITCSYLIFFLPGKYIVSGSEDKSLRLWDIFASKCIKKLDGHVDAITCIIWKVGISLSLSLTGLIEHRLFSFSLLQTSLLTILNLNECIGN